mmetsp:Transcript_15923/g.49761  ORF Transcript_15923/g.49761 Transcript_15923/m.49761 type:complete len:380 (+) Transcript_15923:3685-4824(+)
MDDRTVIPELLQADREQLHDLAGKILVGKCVIVVKGSVPLVREVADHYWRVGNLPKQVTVVAEGMLHEQVVVVGPPFDHGLHAKVFRARHQDLRKRPRDSLSKLVIGGEDNVEPKHSFSCVQCAWMIDRGQRLPIKQVLVPKQGVVFHLQRGAAHLESPFGTDASLGHSAKLFCHCQGLHVGREAIKVHLVLKAADERDLVLLPLPPAHRMIGRKRYGDTFRLGNGSNRVRSIIRCSHSISRVLYRPQREVVDIVQVRVHVLKTLAVDRHAAANHPSVRVIAVGPVQHNVTYQRVRIGAGRECGHNRLLGGHVHHGVRPANACCSPPPRRPRRAWAYPCLPIEGQSLHHVRVSTTQRVPLAKIGLVQDECCRGEHGWCT